MEKKEKGFYGYKMVAACFIIHMVNAGSGGITAVYLPILTKELNFTLAQYGFVVLLGTISAIVCNSMVGNVIAKIGPRWSLLFASIMKLVSTGVMIFSKSIITIAFTSVVTGIVGAFGTLVCQSAFISEWFIDKRASMTSIVFGGSGIGSGLFQFLAGVLLTKMPWRSTYYVWLILFGVMSIGTNLLFLRTPEQMNQKPYGWENHVDDTTTDTVEIEKPGLTLKEAKKTSTFKLWLVGMIFISMLYTTVRTYGPTFWQENGVSTIQSASYSGMLAIFASLFVMISGTLAEKYGPRFFTIYTVTCYILGTLLIIIFPNTSPIFSVLSVLLVGAAAPCDGIYPSTITPNGFGMKEYPKIQAQFMLSYYIGLSLQPIIVGQIVKYTNNLSYAFIESIVLGAIGLVLILIGLKKAPYKGEQKTVSVEESTN